MRKKEPRIATPKTPLFVDDFATTGQGIATLNSELIINQQSYSELVGVKILLWNALPGEIISKFQIVTQKPHFIEGIAIEFEKQSEFRVAPQDKQFLSTSPWQILNDQAELSAKSNILVSLFTHLDKTHPISKDLVLNIPIHQSPKQDGVFTLL